MLIFFVLLFSPVIVPITQFPSWLAAIHQWLPFHHMAVVIRDGLGADVGRAYLVLGAWTLGSWLLATRMITRRG